MGNNWKIIAFGICILFLISFIPSIYKEISNPNILNSTIVGVITGFFVSIFSAIVIIKYQYFLAYNRLVGEINDNFEKLQFEKIEAQFKLMREKSLRTLNTGEWIGFDKLISVFIMALSEKAIKHDQYRYLSNNEIKNFILQGHHTNLQYDTVHNLILFYFYCENFSVKEQDCEKYLNHDVRKKHPENLQEETENTINMIKISYYENKDLILQHYRSITENFQKISLFDIEKWLFI